MPLLPALIKMDSQICSLREREGGRGEVEEAMTGFCLVARVLFFKSGLRVCGLSNLLENEIDISLPTGNLSPQSVPREGTGLTVLVSPD